MALLPIHNVFVFNRKLVPVNEFVPSENEGGIYEVLRVVNGVPLFLEEHLERLYCSANIAGKTIPFTYDDIRLFLRNLILQNNVTEGNILISCKINLKVFFITHKYPTQHQYANGVNCGVLHAERINPNAKVFQTQVRKLANERIVQNDFYEVLLVDHNHKVTEGSRTNVFFIKGNKVVTSKAEKVLLGITRMKTITCVQEIGLELFEEDVMVKDLENYDAIFLTGTSPKILPIKRVGKLEFDINNLVLRRLMKQFDLLMHNYIKNAQL